MKMPLDIIDDLPPPDFGQTPPFVCLTDPHSVTAKLRALGELQINCLSDQAIENKRYSWCRETLLTVDDQPMVWAVALFPADTLAANPWIKTWGNRSLGDQLFGDNGWQRQEMKAYRLHDSHPILQNVHNDHDMLALPSLRCSCFSRQGLNFELYELFSLEMSA